MGSLFKSRRITAGIVCAIFAVGSFLLPVYGSELEDMKEEQQEIQERIQSNQQSLKEAERKQKSIFDQLRSLNDAIDEIMEKLESIRAKLTQTEKEIEITEEELAEAQARLEERMGVLADRLKEIYQQGDVNYLEVLLQATSFRDFLVRYHLLEKIAEQDMELIDEIEAEKQEIERKKADLEIKRQELALLERDARANREQLEQQKAEKQSLMAALETEKETIEKALKELDHASNVIAQKIRAIQARNGNLAGRAVGKLAWPTPGYSFITSNYGWRIHPILGTKRMHTGIDIGAPMGADIFSSESGTVIYAGWLGAYGNAVVVDHGGGISTLYGHMSRISVREGQSVGFQDKVGDVGSTGWSTGPHLHFEVRKNGEPVDPWNYLR